MGRNSSITRRVNIYPQTSIYEQSKMHWPNFCRNVLSGVKSKVRQSTLLDISNFWCQFLVDDISSTVLNFHTHLVQKFRLPLSTEVSYEMNKE